MKDTSYAFCVARIRALENKLLTKQDIETLMSFKDLPSAIDYLVQRNYAEQGENINGITKRQNFLLNKLLEESAPCKDELKKLYILNDYFNIKVFVKCAVENRSADEYLVYPTSIDCRLAADKIPLADFSFLKDEYEAIAKKAYNVALKNASGKYSDTIIEKEAIDELTRSASKKKSGMLGEINAFLADTANIKIALRCALTAQSEDYIKEAIGACSKLDRNKLVSATIEGYDVLISYLSSTDYKKGVELYTLKPSSFEKWIDDSITEITSRAVYTSFGFAPVVAYFYKKNLEIKTVRMILSAVKSGVDKQIIAERVREQYA